MRGTKSLSYMTLAISALAVTTAYAQTECFDGEFGVPGANGPVRALCFHDIGSGLALYVGGAFTQIGDANDPNRIARWDGTAWSALGGGTDGNVLAIADGQGGDLGQLLYVGGGFIRVTGVGGAQLWANRIAKWDGNDWATIGRGLNGLVRALLVFNDGAGDRLYIGGAFTAKMQGQPGTMDVYRIAKSNGSNLAALDPDDHPASGFNNTVYALAAYDDGTGPALYAAGAFTATQSGTPLERIARWDPQSKTWSPVGAGFNNTVYALAVVHDAGEQTLYAGGAFTDDGHNVNPNSLLHVAKWDGQEWLSLAEGVDGPVRALHSVSYENSDVLYVGGAFTHAGDLLVDHLARWDGGTWSSHCGGTDGTVHTLADNGDGPGALAGVYVGGNFTTTGGIPSANTARTCLVDSDADGLPDCLDNCPGDYNPGQADIDGDAVGDVCDNCPNDYNRDQSDSDEDGIGDACDNCPDNPNPDQADADQDGWGDACDNCPDDYNPSQTDTDGDTEGDACDEDDDDDEILDVDDNCPLLANPDQLDTDDDGAGDECDNCPGQYNPEQRDSDGDGAGDACDADSSSTRLIGIKARDGTVLESFAYDSYGKLTTRITTAGVVTAYDYDAGKLATITHVDTTDNNRTRVLELAYDPETDQYLGSVGQGCACAGTRKFVYRDTRNRVTKITTADVDPANTITLEEFHYQEEQAGEYGNIIDSNGDGIIDDRLTQHKRWNDEAQGLVVVETRDYGDSGPDEPYTVRIYRPVDDAKGQVRDESYDAAGRLTSVTEWHDLQSGPEDPTGPTSVTNYEYIQAVGGSGSVIAETRTVTRPSGIKDVWKWWYSGGSNEYKLVQSYTTDAAEGAQKNIRLELHEYNAQLGNYRMSVVLEPTGRQIDYDYYDPEHPDRVFYETHKAPGGVGPYADDDVLVTYEYDDAGRIFADERPGPEGGVVRTQYEYDDAGRLKTVTKDFDGLNRATEYRYNGFGEQVLVRNPDGLARVTLYNDYGQAKCEYACDYTGDLSSFDIYSPPAETMLSYRSYEYHAVSGRVEREAVALVDEAPFDLDPDNPTCDFSCTDYDLDPDTGTWLRHRSVPYQPPDTPSAWTDYGYDYQGRTAWTESPGGVVNQTVFDGRGLVSDRVLADDPLSPTLTLTTSTDYTADGQVELVTYPDETARRYGYDNWGRLEHEYRCQTSDCTDPITTVYERDDAGLVLRKSAEGVEDVSTLYDTWGRPYWARQRATYGVDDDIDSDGIADIVTLTEYNLVGSVYRSAVKGPSGTLPGVIEDLKDQITGYTYNNVGDIDTITRYNVDDQQQSVPEVTQYVYDYPNRTRTEIVDPAELSITTTYAHDAMGRTVLVTDPEGHYREQFYDSRGNFIRRVAYEADPVGGDVEKSQERWKYNERGLLEYTARMASADADPSSVPNRAIDRVTDYDYDDDGRVLGVTTYNMNSATPLVTQHQYDGLGRLEITTDAIGTWVQNVYETDPPTGLLDYREMHDLPSRANYKADYGYDEYKRVETEARSEIGGSTLTTTYDYDDADRVTSVIDPETVETAYSYDLLGRRLTVTENSGGIDPDPRTTVFRYDRLGRLKEQEADDAGVLQTTEYEYDLFGRRTRIVFPDSIDPATDSVRYEYDVAGRLVEKTDQRDNVVEYAYYNRGLLHTRTASCPTCGSGFEPVYDEFDYDGLGRMTSAVRQVGDPPAEEVISRSDFDYSGLGDMEYESQELFGSGTPIVIEYDYDQAGNRRSLDCTTTDTVCIEYDAYDELNRVKEIYRDSTLLANYVYDGKYLDRRQVTTTATTTTYVEYDPGYDAHRRIDPVVNRINAGTPEEVATFDYAFDGVGNRESTIQGGNAVHSADITYAYDNLHRLTSAEYAGSDIDPDGVETFDDGDLHRMDLLSNRTLYDDTRDGPTITYDLNNLANEYTKIKNKYVSYDAAGNMREDDRKFRYSYDFENRLTKAERLGLSQPPPPGVGGDGMGPQGGGGWQEPYVTVATFAYDARGRRIRATYYDGQGDVTADTLYYYDGQRVLAEFDYDEGTGEQTLLRYFVDGPIYVDEHVLMHDATTGQDYYYLLQELYTVGGLVDENGGLLEAYAYDGYGGVRFFELTGPDPVEIPLSAIGNPYYFTGRRLDPIPNPFASPVWYRQLYHYRAREYDPRHGRFLQRDPSEYVDGMNLYEYVRSAPLVYGDPYGRSVEPENITNPEEVLRISKRFIASGNDYGQRAFQYLRYPIRLAYWDEQKREFVEAAVRQYVTQLAQLVSLGAGFSPGGRGKTSERNKFVYTCKSGWIDVGHFHLSAAATYVVDKKRAMAIGNLIERTQQIWQNLGFEDGWAMSAYTIEDLPSNALGVELGGLIRQRTTLLHLGELAQLAEAIQPTGFDPSLIAGGMAALGALTGAGPTLETFDIYGQMETFFKERGAIENLKKWFPVEGGKTAKKILEEDVAAVNEAYLEGPGMRNFSTTPYFIRCHYVICTPDGRPR